MAAEIVSILNLKGGVGKTTTTINLGKALSLQGKKVLLIDTDPQSNLTEGLGISDPEKTIFQSYKEHSELPIIQLEPNFHIIPSELNLATIESEVDGNINRYYLLSDVITPIKSIYDFILIDCPPSIGVYTINAITASTKYLVTAQAARYSITGLQSVKELIDTKIKQRLNPTIKPLGILITLMTKTIAADVSLEELEGDYKEEIFNTRIRQNTKLVESQLAGEDIFSYDKGSNGAKDYMSLAKEILNK